MSSFDDYLSIDTPENVAFGYKVVGIGSRFLAALVDTILIVVLQIVVNFTLLFLLGIFIENISNTSRIFIWVAALVGLLAFALFWGYYIFFEMLWNGQSPGKRWVGLRVIRNDGTPITLVESIIRNLVRLVDFLPIYYGIGVAAMFIDKQSRRLGDLAAGTLVVQDRAAITLESLDTKTGSFRSTQAPSEEALAWPVERLTREERRVIEEFVRRRYELRNRSTLAQRLAGTLAERLDLPAPSNDVEAEDFVVEIFRASQRRAAGREAES